MTVSELLPTRSRFGCDEPVEIEVRGPAGSGQITIWSLGNLIHQSEYSGHGTFTVSPLAPGGYGIELRIGDRVVRTAVEVSDDARARLRYGFVVDYSPGREVTEVSDSVRRLHLTGVQFYDWAYRHADLLGGGEDYRDALGQPVSLDTVRRLVSAVQRAGSRALGYAAVYAVGPEEWPGWKHHALLTASGEPYALGDFLFLIDPAVDEWLASFTSQLRQAMAGLGFDGFHLDQYGYPKRAMRADGAAVDVAESFQTMIGSVRAAAPEAHLVFNNVNDFPTWATARSPQDAVYIEVWPPQVTLGSLASVATRARSISQGKPVVVAAYQHVYDSAPAATADLATSFTMATLFSHGATQLLAGEADRILVDPYYVRNHVVEPSTAAMLTRWYNFVVEHDALLLAPDIIEVTGAYTGSYNDDCDVSFVSAPVAENADAGSVWRRVTQIGDRLVVHLINLIGQTDALWDSPRNPPISPGTGTLRVRLPGPDLPRVQVADPDRTPRLIDVSVRREGDYAIAELPAPILWQLILIDLVGAQEMPLTESARHL